ncbi:hypothetical protein IAR55_007128 [Kwoniella newhampshirensis]|uniref:Major facilitator superfamily (MFS) profile domain-containing protein n=1 Tax=Kwoniella newhampshirensis TaxID=1651941 RepID=A0AAW0YE42_9TREE
MTSPPHQTEPKNNLSTSPTSQHSQSSTSTAMTIGGTSSKHEDLSEKGMMRSLSEKQSPRSQPHPPPHHRRRSSTSDLEDHDHDHDHELEKHDHFPSTPPILPPQPRESKRRQSFGSHPKPIQRGNSLKRQSTLPSSSTPGSIPGPSRQRAGTVGGVSLSRIGTGHSLSRMSSIQATEMESELRRHVSLHGIPSANKAVLEDKRTLDLGQGKGEEEVVVVDWLPDDPDNPFNWSTPRKYATLLVAVFITFIGAANLVSTAPLATWGTVYFGVSREVFLLGLTLPMLGIAFAPLVLAPLSEVFGRNMIYQITSVGYALLFIPHVTTRNWNGVLAARFFQGIMNSVGNSMVGGTVADMFLPNQRGPAMGVFTLMIFNGQAIGITAISWMGQNLGIRWTYGIQGIVAVISVILNAIVLRETRSDVLLSRRAKNLTKKTGIKHVCAADLQKTDFMVVMRVSLVRPLQYLFTEPIVSALSAWIGFAWACIFLGGSSIVLVFESYGFNVAQAASFEITMGIGAVVGLVSNIHQEYLYRRAGRKSANGRSPPEARLYWAAYGGLMFPLSLYIFGWTGRAGVVHWAVPAVFLIFMNWGVFTMYLGVFNYLADAYETYSSSAQAAQSFVRNLASGLFPLFARQMYVNLGYPQASTLVASIALLLSAAPFLLLFYGKRLRMKSKVTRALCKDD